MTPAMLNSSRNAKIATQIVDSELDFDLVNRQLRVLRPIVMHSYHAKKARNSAKSQYGSMYRFANKSLDLKLGVLCVVFLYNFGLAGSLSAAACE